MSEHDNFIHSGKTGARLKKLWFTITEKHTRLYKSLNKEVENEDQVAPVEINIKEMWPNKKCGKQRGSKMGESDKESGMSWDYLL